MGKKKEEKKAAMKAKIAAAVEAALATQDVNATENTPEIKETSSESLAVASKSGN